MQRQRGPPKILFKVAKTKSLNFDEVVNVQDIINFEAFDLVNGKRIGKFNRNDIIRKFG